MIIAITGLVGSGKDTLAQLVASKTGMRHLNLTFKDLAKQKGISLIELQRLAEKDPSIDKEFDDMQKREAAKGDCVTSTWLGPWILPAELRIFLYASEEVRAQRVAKREGISEEEAIKYIRERENSNRKRYLKLYNIDITNYERYDLVLSSERYKPEQLLEFVMLAKRWL
ncbi:MAG: cytidylate kinase family protein [Candidatus Anstonellales archaeon]